MEEKLLNYKTQSLKYLADAEELLNKGDFAQASEKLWGATASLVKAVAESKNLVHNGHAQLFKIVNFLSKETGDDEINKLFHFANSLHVNFYENWLTPEQVIEGKKEVEHLIQKLENILET